MEGPWLRPASHMLSIVPEKHLRVKSRRFRAYFPRLLAIFRAYFPHRPVNCCSRTIFMESHWDASGLDRCHPTAAVR
jgi:hypothetical protein